MIAKPIIIAAMATLSLMVSLPAEGPEPMHDTEWLIETVDNGKVETSPSMVLDNMGYPHIAYFERASHNLKYTRWNGTTWNTEIVDSVDHIIRSISLILDSQGYPHIGYQDVGIVELKYARWTGSMWEIEIVDPGCYCGDGASFALDSTDTPHVSYHTPGGPNSLKHAKRIAPDSWSTEILDSSGYATSYTSIAVDSTDNVHISYHRMDNQTNHDLKYAKWDGTAWNTGIVEENATGFYNVLALDGQDKPHISYRGSNRTLKHAKWNGMEWVIEIADPNWFNGYDTSVTIDSTDSPHISYDYFDGIRNELRYAVWNGTAWNTEIVDTADWPGIGSSIAVNSTDVPHIAFVDQSSQDLKYARKVKAIPPSEPVITDSILSGPNLEDVTIFWTRSLDDGAGRNDVIGYDIRESTEYSGTYTLIASVPAYGFLSYNWTCLGCGEGDSNDHFFYIEAKDSAHSTPSPNQAGKLIHPLSAGPNLVSVPLIQSDENIMTVLQTVKYDKAWFYDSSSQEWKWYMKHKGYRRGLWNMNHTMGLWVNVTSDSNLTVAGIVPAQTTIHLYEGWNLVSFPSFNSSYSVADLKLETGSTRVEGYDSTPEYYLRILADVEVLQAGYGYWVRVDAATDWTVEGS